VENFAGQWLHLRELATVTPEVEGFDENLREAFIERANAVGDSISTATPEQVEKLVADAQAYGGDSVEMAYALWTRGRLARWSQKDLGPGASSLDRAVGLAEAHGLGPDIVSRWLRTLSVVCDDLNEAQRAIDAAEKARTVSTRMRGRLLSGDECPGPRRRRRRGEQPTRLQVRGDHHRAAGVGCVRRRPARPSARRRDARWAGHALRGR